MESLVHTLEQKNISSEALIQILSAYLNSISSSFSWVAQGIPLNLKSQCVNLLLSVVKSEHVSHVKALSLSILTCFCREQAGMDPIYSKTSLSTLISLCSPSHEPNPSHDVPREAFKCLNNSAFSNPSVQDTLSQLDAPSSIISVINTYHTQNQSQSLSDGALYFAFRLLFILTASLPEATCIIIKKELELSFISAIQAQINREGSLPRRNPSSAER